VPTVITRLVVTDPLTVTLTLFAPDVVNDSVAPDCDLPEMPMLLDCQLASVIGVALVFTRA
jgi:hypothetical protein